jgi:hypothetical protein
MLIDGSIDASVDAQALGTALAGIALGADADWTMTLADVLIPWLRDQRASGAVQLAVRSTTGASEELEAIAFVELARRIAAAQDAPDCKLALPATSISNLTIKNSINLSIKWGVGDIYKLSVVRATRCDDIPIQTP